MKPIKYLSIPFFTIVILFTASILFAQVKIGTNPTTMNAANNLEVEASNPWSVSSQNTGITS